LGTGRTAVEVARIRKVAAFPEGGRGRIVADARKRRALDLSRDIILRCCDQLQRRVVASGVNELDSLRADA